MTKAAVLWRTVLRRRGLTVGRAAALFGVLSVCTIAVIGWGTLAVLRPRLIDHEIDRARSRVTDVAKRLVEPAITAGLVAGDRDAYRAFDDIVRQQVLRPEVIGVMLWTRSGSIVYALDEERVGYRQHLSDRAVETLAGGATAEAVDASGLPGWTGGGKDDPLVIDVYVPVAGPGGEPLLWESYLRRDEVAQEASGLLTTVTVVGVVAAGLFLTVQTAAAIVLARLRERERRDRVRLLRRASDAATTERRRIAADLHDGVMQELTGIVLDLGALEADLPRGAPVPAGAPSAAPPPAPPAELARRLRTSLGELRSLVVEIYPADLHRSGLPVALATLLDRLGAGIATQLDVDEDLALEVDSTRLVYRAAQEALRNVRTHAHATEVVVTVERRRDRVVLVVADDGVGFDPAAPRAEGGHLGLSLLGEMAEAAGGHLEVRSAPGRGTTVHVEIPA